MYIAPSYNPDPQRKPPFPCAVDWKHPLSRGLVGCWLLNERAGKTIVNIADIYPGYIGQIVDPNNTIWQASSNGAGLKFDGATNYAKVGIWPGYPRISIVCGITYIAGNDTNFFASDDSWTTNRVFQFRTGYTNKFLFLTFVGGAVKEVYGNTTLADNNYYSLCAVSDGTSIYAYVNGNLDKAPATGGILDPDASTTTIGARSQSLAYNMTEYCSSYMHHLFLYDRALQPSAIQQLYISPYQFILPC